MTPEQIKAQEIVDRHRKVLSVYYHQIVAQQAAVYCAISEVEGKIELFNEILESDLNNDFDILMRRGEYIEILQELKNMNV